MLLELHSGRIQAAFNLENGQLVSLQHKGKELMHGGGRPAELQEPEDAQGWGNSEIVMFPVIGPVKDNAIMIRGERYPMGQHGIARHLPWTVLEQRTDRIVFQQRYEGRTPVPNNKIPGPAVWPFSYTLEKRFQLMPEGISVRFAVKNDGDEPMQYMIGWHPAFKILDERIAGKRTAEVQDSRAVELDVNSISFGPLHITTDLPHLTLWSPKDSSLLCIEPMSRLQVWEGLEKFSENEFVLEPEEMREHAVEIRIA